MINKVEIKDEIIINFTDKEIKRAKLIITKIQQEIKNHYNELILKEQLDITEYNFSRLKRWTIKHKKLVNYVLKEVINEYKKELKNLEMVFLACSFGRNTNKISSDLDLHFIYKDNNYDYRYEEIICYIVTTILRKKRDDVDPKLIINFDKELKKKYEDEMNNKNLKIILKSNNFMIKYNYKFNKKKKFFLQYNNSKTVSNLENYICNEGIIFNNQPWAHSFDVIFGKKNFEKMYKIIYNREKKLITSKYIDEQIELLITDMNIFVLNDNESKISKIKKEYQSQAFTFFYRFLNILRLHYIKLGKKIEYLNVYDLYNKVDYIDKIIIYLILDYIWEIRKMSIFCNYNDISYSIHSDSLLKNYNLSKFKLKFLRIKDNIEKRTEEILKYE